MGETDRMARANSAERILNDPIYLESFERVRAAILEQFEKSPARDSEGREYLFKMLKALNDAKGYLEQAVQDGQILIHLQKQKRLFKLFR